MATEMAFLADEMAMEAYEVTSIFVLCAVVFSLIVMSMCSDILFCLGISYTASDVETAAEKLIIRQLMKGPNFRELPADSIHLAESRNSDTCSSDSMGQRNHDDLEEVAVHHVVGGRHHGGGDSCGGGGGGGHH
ncbi:hypothetical protein CRG98_048339 [Punica granatum]|uniref:Uncharacterized protein n=1 Tax=Punica granatum TaxID=22663 RepID=A0A2I0HHU1_PUNGR|nr:hypothetical protein CRG98_048339 [Punica granatum]